MINIIVYLRRRHNHE